MGLDVPFIWKSLETIGKTIPLTMAITVGPLVFGTILAIGITLIRLYKIKLLDPVASFYVSFFRSTPAIMHIMLIYLGIPMILDKLSAEYGWHLATNKIPIAVFVVAALSLTASAYLSEIIRSGILAVDSGEVEAAYACGLTHAQAIRRVVLPQAFIIALPNFINLFIGFLHTSSIAAIVSVPEITGTANIVASYNFEFLESYIAAAIIYWGLTILIECLGHLVERRTVRYQGGVI